MTTKMPSREPRSGEEAGPRKPRRRWLKLTAALIMTVLFLGVLAAAGLVYGLYHFGRGLPDYQQLAAYEPPVVTRIHAGDGSLLREYAREKRLFVPIEAIPQPVIQAFLSAEDKNFYNHGGLDYRGIMRAMITNLRNISSNRRLVGASTITQQVAKNFLLTSEVSYERKIKEAILAYRIERAFTKDQILELYLNEIYLGFGSYGVAAAALNYFDKALDELTLAEAAYLAALPKAPNNYHPVRRKEAAVARRNWVLARMAEDGHIPMQVARAEQEQPLNVRLGGDVELFHADYFTEEVRRLLYSRYGEKGLYEGGLSVHTTLDPKLQAIAERVLRRGMVAYDRRHGWRGPLQRLPQAAMTGEGWRDALQELRIPLGMPGWRLAVVTDVDDEAAAIGLADGGRGRIPLSELSWARRALGEGKLGPAVEKAGDVLRVGDVIAVEEVKAEEGTHFALRQIPEVGGALVALDPHTGRMRAMVGGFDYAVSEFNRATQALRQPGSAFKPFVYAAALDSGFTPSSLVLDAPFVMDQGAGQGRWKPSNYANDFLGPSTLRVGLEKSRNLMTVRLAQYVGMDRVADYARRFGIHDQMQPTLAMALGAGETTVARLTAAYAMLVNGGKEVRPILVDRIQDRRGRIIYRSDPRPCEGCAGAFDPSQPPPQLADMRRQVVAAETAYQIVSMLEGVVQRGTGRVIASVGKPLAGKTGTTNDSNDAWFVGFSPDLVVGVYIGYDQPRSLGGRETGSSIAAPIFRDFMAAALKDVPAIPFRIPSGLRLVRVNARTGLPTYPSDPQAILEAFIPGTEPTGERAVLDGGEAIANSGEQLTVGTGGLY